MVTWRRWWGRRATKLPPKETAAPSRARGRPSDRHYHAPTLMPAATSQGRLARGQISSHACMLGQF